MSKENQIITLRDNAKHELMQIKTIEDGLTHFNKIKSIETWVKAEKMDAELQNIVAEQKLRTQRILGALIKEGQEKGGLRKQGQSVVPPSCQTGGVFKTLNEVGINEKQSASFQKIASIPEDAFENFIQAGKEKVNEAVKELTTTGALRLAESLKEKKNVDQDEEEEREMWHKKTRSIIKEINLMPLVYRNQIRQSINK